MHSVVHHPQIQKAATAILGEQGFAELIDFLMRNPETGNVMPGTGGVRKLRFARPGMGKSGGARVVTYYQDQKTPLFLLGIFAKNDVENLSKEQRNALLELTQRLKQSRPEANMSADNQFFDTIKSGLEHAADYLEGKAVPATLHRICVPPTVNVRAIRERMGMTQRNFCATFGFAERTLKSWEAGERTPESAARVLLRTIEQEPDAVLRANGVLAKAKPARNGKNLVSRVGFEPTTT